MTKRATTEMTDLGGIGTLETDLREDPSSLRARQDEMLAAS